MQHLHDNAWDDFGQYKTLYYLTFYDRQGVKHSIGGVKIGSFGMAGQRPELPRQFRRLPDRYFSLGQDRSYYEGIQKLRKSDRDDLLQLALYRDSLRAKYGEVLAAVLRIDERSADVTYLNLPARETVNVAVTQASSMTSDDPNPGVYCRSCPYATNLCPAGLEYVMNS